MQKRRRSPPPWRRRKKSGSNGFRRYDARPSPPPWVGRTGGGSALLPGAAAPNPALVRCTWPMAFVLPFLLPWAVRTSGTLHLLPRGAALFLRKSSLPRRQDGAWARSAGCGTCRGRCLRRGYLKTEERRGGSVALPAHQPGQHQTIRPDQHPSGRCNCRAPFPRCTAPAISPACRRTRPSFAPTLPALLCPRRADTANR